MRNSARPNLHGKKMRVLFEEFLKFQFGDVRLVDQRLEQLCFPGDADYIAAYCHPMREIATVSGSVVQLGLDAFAWREGGSEAEAAVIFGDQKTEIIVFGEQTLAIITDQRVAPLGESVATLLRPGDEVPAVPAIRRRIGL